MVHEGICNPIVTLKGYPKKIWGLFGQKAHKTQQITLSQKGGLSLTLMSHGQTYKPNANPSVYPMKLLGLVGMVTHTACARQQNSLIGSIPKIEFFIG